MKTIIKIATIALAISLTGCNQPRKVKIIRDVTETDISINVRKGYVFAEDAYSIVDTEQGYDIVVHCIRE